MQNSREGGEKDPVESVRMGYKKYPTFFCMCKSRRIKCGAWLWQRRHEISAWKEPASLESFDFHDKENYGNFWKQPGGLKIMWVE